MKREGSRQLLLRVFAMTIVTVIVLPVRAASPFYSGVEKPPAPTTRPSILNDVGIDQHLGAQLPLDAVFRDEAGREVHLGDYFGKRPVILTLVYYKCPMLCTMVLNDVNRQLNAMPTSAGEDFDVVTVSFDPRETPDLAAAKKRQYLKSYTRKHAEEGWHFLTGDEASIHKLTDTVGFRYAYDPKFDQYAHASGAFVITPSGRVARYFFGIEYSARDLRLALAEASEGKVAPKATEQFLMYCFHYDPATGKYGLAVTNALKVGAILTMLGLSTFWLLMARRDRRIAAGVESDTTNRT